MEQPSIGHISSGLYAGFANSLEKIYGSGVKSQVNSLIVDWQAGPKRDLETVRASQ